MTAPRFDHLIKDLVANLPETLKSYREEFAKHLETSLQNKLADYDLVPRDEFEIQCIALARIETRLRELEELINQQQQTKQQSSTKKAPAKKTKQATQQKTTKAKKPTTKTKKGVSSADKS